MKTQLEYAKEGTATNEMESVAKNEKIDLNTLISNISSGSIVIMKRGDAYAGIGKGLSTKVNVNIGTSSLKIDPDEEVKKARIAQKYGADTISDLSMGGDISLIRKMIMENTTLPLTTVAIYQVAAEKGLRDMDYKDIIINLKQQAKEGVSSFVLHCIDKKTLDIVKKERRIMGVVSKGGSITGAYMMLNNCENPFVSNFDEILKILKKHDIVLSL
ncbi:MAG: phosphomethylpyrimidine synthase ThiC, partial [Candidatus Methanoperedens sp.]|nr:phosphomethylpyrimidine synthase ThiC [Candidatus Methanoperedens sp.]